MGSLSLVCRQTGLNSAFFLKHFQAENDAQKNRKRMARLIAFLLPAIFASSGVDSLWDHFFTGPLCTATLWPSTA